MENAGEGSGTIGATGRPVSPAEERSLAYDPPLGTRPYTVTFEEKDGNTYGATSSNGGESLVGDNAAFAMQVRSPSKVVVTLDWDDEASDLDLRVGQQGEDTVYAEGGKPETVVLDRVQGLVDLTVAPFLVGPTGTTYTLSAKVTPLGADTDGDGLTDPGDQCDDQRGPAPSGCPDANRDGVPDRTDECPKHPSGTANGCPPPAREWIELFVDGTQRERVRVDRVLGVGRYAVAAPVRPGSHRVRVAWLDRRGALDSATRTVR